jgi:hypothetical protein
VESGRHISKEISDEREALFVSVKGAPAEVGARGRHILLCISKDAYCCGRCITVYSRDDDHQKGFVGRVSSRGENHEGGFCKFCGGFCHESTDCVRKFLKDGDLIRRDDEGTDHIGHVTVRADKNLRLVGYGIDERHNSTV